MVSKKVSKWVIYCISSFFCLFLIMMKPSEAQASFSTNIYYELRLSNKDNVIQPEEWQEVVPNKPQAILPQTGEKQRPIIGGMGLLLVLLTSFTILNKIIKRKEERK